MKYILPGMGATSGMYTGPWRQIPDCCFIDWPAYEGEVSLFDIADRLVRQYKINQNDSLIGSSLGGMVGLEISAITGSGKVYLIGSAVNAGELSAVSKLFMPLTCRTVVKSSQVIASCSGSGIMRMYAKADPDFVMAMSSAILKWRGCRGELTKIFRIRQSHKLF